MLMGDEARIAQVVNNLLSNAFKFTSHGEVELRVKTASETSWTISVRDTGIGIPPHALDFIFEEFRQVDGTSQRAYGGSGLGLAITRNLTRIMGGEVHVSSKLGEGSTFTVILPMVVPERVGEMVA
jgi:signal transduction histidine kinase